MAGDGTPFSFWRFSDDLRSHSNASEDVQWNLAASKLALVDRMRNLKFNPHQNLNPNQNPNTNLKLNPVPGPNPNPGSTPNPNGRLFNEKVSRGSSKSSKQKLALPGDGTIGGQNANPNPFVKAAGGKNQKESAGRNTENNSGQQQIPSDKRFKSLPPAETLPRNETLGGYVFVCNNDTMEEDLKRHLFGLPQRYRDSVRAIRPGLPLFLYNYTTHQLHGIFEATTFGGSNIDPTAWEDKKCKGESRFPAQVRTRPRKLCKPLEEDSFRPVLHHYDGPKFRLELSMPETVALLDLFTGGGSS